MVTAMSQRLVLHVGLMKSGTSFIQSHLFANQDLLRERGVLIPGRQWSDQVQATLDIIRGEGRSWDRIANEVRAHDGTSVVSMEFLGPARPAVVQRVVAAFPDHVVEVIVTVRDLNRSIAAMWQETIQNGRTWTWPEYVDGLTAWRPGHRQPDHQPTQAGRTFWRQQNAVRICRTWSDEVGAGRLALVTVPPPGAPRGLLWERFAEVLGTDPDGFVPAPASNESIGAASALALRRLNELLAHAELPFPQGAQLRKKLLAKQVLAARKAAEPSIGLPVASWVRDHADQMRHGLQDLNVRLVGDWDDLEPVDVPGIDPATVSSAEVTEAALAGLSGLMEIWIRADDERGSSREFPSTRTPTGWHGDPTVTTRAGDGA